jgi:4-amino-4-deoxy-L-arabinose transferase-like glycosyltransferase
MKRIQLTPAFQRLLSVNFLLTAVIVILSLAFFSGLMAVPFHPDESTNIYMSSDLNQLFNNPNGLIWHSNQSIDLQTHYRLVDPPLTRYLIGIVRSILNVQPLKVDWNWSMSWQQNAAIGSLPSTSQLLAGRMVSAIFFPFSLLLVFLLGRQIHSSPAGWAALLFFASSSLVLLHTRRAMAEPALVFFCLLSLWVIIRYPDHPWVSAIPLALAFNAKYSAAPFVLVGVVNIIWRTKPLRIREMMEDLGFFFLIFVGITFALNPFLWGDPIQAFLAAIGERQSLVTSQTAALAAIRPDLVSSSWWNHLQMDIVQLFFAPLSIQDIGNYTVDLQQASQIYLANPLHQLWRGLLPGSLFLFCSLIGLYLSVQGTFKHSQTLRANVLILMAALAEIAGLSLLITLPFQRYVLPLVPFVCLWSGISIAFFLSRIDQIKQKKAT